jgi:hypothetical protein
MTENKEGQAIQKKGGISAPVNSNMPAKAPPEPKDASSSASPTNKGKG